MPLSLPQQLKHTAPDVLSRYPILFAYLYGSYATDSAHAFSDLDIGVYLEPEAVDRTLEIELDLALALDTALDHMVGTEARVINNLPLTFLGQVVTNGVLLYCRDESIRVDFEVQVRKYIFDTSGKMPVIMEESEETP